jgi:hypothetical protein
VLAVVAAVIGSVGDYLLSQLLLPQASTPLTERLSISGYLDYLSGTFDIVDVLAIAVLVVVAWRSARSLAPDGKATDSRGPQR